MSPTRIGSKGSRMRRFLQWGSAAGITLLALAAIYALREFYSARKELRIVLHRIEAEGTVRPLEEVVARPPAEALDNGRKLLSAIEKLRDLRSTSPAVRLGPGLMRLVAPGKALSGVFSEKPYYMGDEFSPDWEEFRRQVTKSTKILEEAREILKKPTALEYRYTAPVGAPDFFAQANDLLVWLRASALLKFHDGDITGAIEDLTGIRQLCTVMGDSGAILRLVFGFGMWHYGLTELFWELLENGSLTDADLLKLQEIATGDFVSGNLRAMEAEFRVTPFVLRQFADAVSSDLAWTFAPDSSGFLGTEFAITLRKFLWPRLWMYAEEAKALSNWENAIKATHKLISTKNWKLVAPGLKSTASKRPYDQWRFPWAEAFSGAKFSRSVLGQGLRAENLSHMVRTVIALKRYRLRNGDYPDHLDQLLPDYLPSVPIDWYDGLPLKYRRTEGDGFLLYSVGPNGIDEGGDATPVDQKQGFSIASGRDIVWPRVGP